MVEKLFFFPNFNLNKKVGIAVAVILERSGLGRIQTLVSYGGKVWDILYVSTIKHHLNCFIVSLLIQFRSWVLFLCSFTNFWMLDTLYVLIFYHRCKNFKLTNQIIQ